MSKQPAGSIQVEVLKGRLRLRFRYSGKRHVIALGLSDTPTNRTIAEKRAREIELQILLGTFNPEPVRQKTTKPVKFEGDLLGLWQSYTKHRASQIAETTLRLNYRRIELFLTKCSDRSPQGVVAALKLLSPYNQNRTLTQLRACCNWAIAEGYLSDNPFRELLVAARRTKSENIAPFTQAEEEAILEAFRGQHYFHLVNFLFLTGCRTSEAIGLTWGDVADDYSSIVFRSAVVNASGKKIRKETKTRKSRTIGTNNKLRELLESLRYGEYQEPVFPNQSGGLVSARHFNQVWKRVIMPLAGSGKIKKYRPQYQTRHTRITRWLTQGVPVHEVARWVGNSPNIIYTHYAGYLGDNRIPEL